MRGRCFGTRYKPRQLQALTALLCMAAGLLACGPAGRAESAEQPFSAPQAQAYGLEADVSMRSIRVDVAFSGARLVVFGAVNRRPGAAPDPRTLDVVAVIEGARAHLTVRRKSHLFGLWLNTDAITFASAPRYYAVASTRPPAEFASKAVLAELGIGLDDVPILAPSAGATVEAQGKADDFRLAAMGLGAKGHHFMHLDRALSFVGTSLLRGEVDLPGTIPVGELDVRVYLFGGGAVLAQQVAHLKLEREGFENVVYTFAHQHAGLYGVATVVMSAGIGLFASFLAGRRMR